MVIFFFLFPGRKKRNYEYGRVSLGRRALSSTWTPSYCPYNFSSLDFPSSFLRLCRWIFLRVLVQTSYYLYVGFFWGSLGFFFDSCTNTHIRARLISLENNRRDHQGRESLMLTVRRIDKWTRDTTSGTIRFIFSSFFEARKKTKRKIRRKRVGKKRQKKIAYFDFEGLQKCRVHKVFRCCAKRGNKNWIFY